MNVRKLKVGQSLLVQSTNPSGHTDILIRKRYDNRPLRPEKPDTGLERSAVGLYAEVAPTVDRRSSRIR